MSDVPKPGFDWAKITWGHPDSLVSALCSYCSAAFRDDEVPLMLWQKNGRAAKFCEVCQKKWWFDT